MCVIAEYANMLTVSVNNYIQQLEIYTSHKNNCQQNEAALSYRSVRGLQFAAVLVRNIILVNNNGNTYINLFI